MAKVLLVRSQTEKRNIMLEPGEKVILIKEKAKKIAKLGFIV